MNHFRIHRGLGLRHRLVVVVPGAALHIVDDVVAIATLGFFQPTLGFDWMFRQYKNPRQQTESDPA